MTRRCGRDLGLSEPRAWLRVEQGDVTVTFLRRAVHTSRCRRWPAVGGSSRRAAPGMPVRGATSLSGRGAVRRLGWHRVGEGSRELRWVHPCPAPRRAVGVVTDPCSAPMNGPVRGCTSLPRRGRRAAGRSSACWVRTSAARRQDANRVWPLLGLLGRNSCPEGCRGGSGNSVCRASVYLTRTHAQAHMCAHTHTHACARSHAHAHTRTHALTRTLTLTRAHAHMCTHTYVCMHTLTRSHMHTRLARSHTHLYTHAHTCMCTLMCTHTHAFTYAHTRARTLTHAHTYLRTHMCAHALTHTRTHIYTHTHAHAHSPAHTPSLCTLKGHSLELFLLHRLLKGAGTGISANPARLCRQTVVGMAPACDYVN